MKLFDFSHRDKTFQQFRVSNRRTTPTQELIEIRVYFRNFIRIMQKSGVDSYF